MADESIRTPAEQVADLIAERLRDGRYGGRLPGYRALGREFGVSRGAVNAALALLVERKILRSGGARRRRESEGAAKSGSGRTGAKRSVLLLSMDAEGDPHALLTQNLPGWRAAIERAECVLHVDFLAAVHAKRPRRRWDEVLARVNPDRLVLLSPSASVARWAVDSGVRTVCMGGVAPSEGADVLSVSARAMLRRALDELFERGHRDILLPLAGRLPEFSESMRAAVREFFEEHGLRYVERLHAPLRAEGDADIFREMLVARLRERVPSAILVFDAHELACAQWVLQSQKLSVPDEVSLIALSELPQSGWWAPGGGPARFRFDEAKRTKLLVRRLLVSASEPFVRELLAPDFIPGGTLAQARAAD